MNSQFGSGMLRRWFARLTAAILAGSALAQAAVTNQPFAGVVCFSETRTNPPTRLFVAAVELTHPQTRIRVSPGGADPDGPGRWQTTLMQPTKIAAREAFDLVVNGDFFNARQVEDAEGAKSGYRQGIWALVEGPAATGGQAWSSSTIARPCLVVRSNNSVTLESLTVPPPDSREVVSGNTMLIKDGKRVPHSNKARHPRTAVGLNDQRTILTILVVDGRKPGVAIGMDYDELAAEMLRLGCHDALNLDGGGSSVMALRNSPGDDFRILNEPTDGRERAVANVLGVTFQDARPHGRQP